MSSLLDVLMRSRLSPSHPPFYFTLLSATTNHSKAVSFLWLLLSAKEGTTSTYPRGFAMPELPDQVKRYHLLILLLDNASATHHLRRPISITTFTLDLQTSTLRRLQPPISSPAVINNPLPLLSSLDATSRYAVCCCPQPILL